MPTEDEKVGDTSINRAKISQWPEEVSTDSLCRDTTYLKTTGEGPQNLCSVFFMLSVSVDSSRYQVLWSEAEGPAVGSGNDR